MTTENVTHRSLLDPDFIETHGPEAEGNASDQKWCMMCQSWVQPEVLLPVDPTLVRQLASKIAHFLKHGHDRGVPAMTIRQTTPPLLGIEPESDEWYVQQAIEQYASDEIEFDNAMAPQISVGEDGAWVAAWVWVANVEDDDEEPDWREMSHLERQAARYDHNENYLEGE